MSVTHDEGRKAHERGLPVVSCPYSWPSPAATKWVYGWVSAMVAQRQENGLKSPPLQTWRSDGCSAVRWAWRLTTGEEPRWSLACVQHDVHYWLGDAGELTRSQADAELQDTINLRWGSPGWGLVYRLGVRLGGASWTGLPWRWGYGWK